MNNPAYRSRSVASFTSLLIALAPLAAFCSATAAELPKKPNVLFIAIDDLRDWVGFLGDRQVKTPNLDRLAAKGMKFTRSYCAAPVCNPSRTALLTGLRPGQTGVYENGTDWRKVPAASSVTTLPQHFKQNGYFVAGAGKIYHNSYPRVSDWTEFFPRPPRNDEPAAAGAKRRRANEDQTAAAGVGGIKFQPLDCEDSDMGDYAIVSYVVGQLAVAHEQPFFLACGLLKPHMPWNVPRKYYEMYPLEKIELPAVRAHDLDDVPPAGVRMAKPAGDHAAILASGRWKDAVQAYLATITFCDAMIGRLLDGLERSAYKDNTIILCWSDHGWQLGEKEHWRKFALWEEATRSPLIWSVPGLTKPGSCCERTIDFMTMYPTLCDLCALPIPAQVKGKSIRALLADPAASWELPAVTTYLPNNHAVRSERWRYIHYANGDEELYDHTTDPHEWTNRAADPAMASIKAELARWLPTENLGEARTRADATGE
jgi:iduronate 2-sulfatase